MTTTQTRAPAQPVTTCPPSRVVDMIVHWDEAREGDLVLSDGQMWPLEDWHLHVTRPDVFVSYRLNGLWFTAKREWYTAVRRYVEGAEITLTPGQAQTAAAGLDRAADDCAEQAGANCRDCAESAERYCEGCRNLLDVAGEYRELRDKLMEASRAA